MKKLERILTKSAVKIDRTLKSAGKICAVFCVHIMFG